MIGFFKWFDVPLFVFDFSQVFIIPYHWNNPLLIKAVVVLMFVNVVWANMLIFRCMRFVVKSIGETKNIGNDAARLAVSYLSGQR
jgi:hypothetical protein